MKKLLLSSFLMFAVTMSSWATHFVGGNFSVCQTGANTFDVTLRVYRDCNPGNSTIISPTTINVREEATGTLEMTFNLSNFLISQTVLTLGDSCYTPTGICVEEYVFQTTVTLPDDPGGYYFTWDDCCRNNIIDNLATPGSDGMTYYVQIPDPALTNGNCTPDFGSYPTNGYLCIGFDQEIDFNVTDADGDSLAFYLIDPFDDIAGGTKPFATCVWGAGYSLANILGNVVNPPMAIDPITGIITCNPEQTGIFVFSVLVEEWRNGVKIGEVVRDLQYKSLACTIDSPPVITLADSLAVFVDDSICIDAYIYDADGLDTIYLEVTSIDFDVQGTYQAPIAGPDSLYYANWMGTGTDEWFPHLDSVNGAMEGVGEIPMRFCWTPGCYDLDSNYHLSFLAYSMGCSGSDTAYKDVVVHVVNNPPPVLLNVPDSISLSFGESTCLDLIAQDTANPQDTLYLAALSATFDFGSTFVAPSVGNNGGTSMNYYTNFFGIDTVWMTDYNLSNGVPGAVGQIAIRYCWTADCESVFITDFDFSYLAFSSACGSDTVYKDSYMHIDPPLGEVNPLPNIFSPNGDLMNDNYKLLGTNDPCYDVMDVAIYNRWGQLVYESTDPLFEWNGKKKGTGPDCSAGTYFVIINGTYGSTYDQVTGVRNPNVVKDEYYIQLVR